MSNDHQESPDTQSSTAAGSRQHPPRPKKKAGRNQESPKSLESGEAVAKSTKAEAPAKSESSASDGPPAKSGSGTSSSSRRRRSRSKSSQQEATAATGGAAATPKNNEKRERAPNHDSERLSKCAWKIYLAEISEEGVTLVDDAGAKELARRCFKLAEIFLDEQARRD